MPITGEEMRGIEFSSGSGLFKASTVRVFVD
jgi:hypothetical protein